MKTIAPIPTSMSKENALLNLNYDVVLFNTKNSIHMSTLKSLCFFLILFFSSYVSNAQCAYSGTPLTQVGSDYTFCVDNGTTYTTGTVNSGQYVVVNVVKGFTYTFSVGNVFTANENLTILNASTNANVSPSKFASGASGATISNWVATLSGQIKLLLSRGSCSNSNVTGGPITLTLNAVGNTQDSQTAYGTDQWVAHVYNWTGSPAPGGASPSTPSTTTIPFTSANYVGYYNVATESISDTFGGDYNCFPVYSNGVVRTNMYTEQFAVRYRMRSTKTGCYSLSTTGDDGVRVYVDGVKVYDEWKEQSPTSYSNILLYLNGNSDIIFDYYENGGQNVTSFSLTPFNASSNTIAQNTVTVCSGVSPGLLDGSSYTYAGGATNPTISFQWQSSTDNSIFTNISGATSEDYTPPTQTATTTNVVRYYRRIVTAAAATASGCSYTSNVTTVTTSPGVPTTPGTISGIANQCPAITNQVYSISAITNTTSYNWTVPTGWTITAGAGTTSITVTTGAAGQNGTISVAAVNGCGSSTTRTLAVTVKSNNTVSGASSSPTLCINSALTAITHTTTGATGIGTITGLPTGVSATWATNTITISGAPSISGTFNYSILLTGGCGTANATGTIIVNPSLPASVSISASATTICSGTSVTFTATPTNGGTTPTYQWKVNGTNISGQTASTFTSTTLANNDLVTVVMTSNANPCLTGSPATSNIITMTVNPNLPASVSIGATATTICSGTSVTFTATPTNGGTTPSYQWKVNGSNVGTNSATYTTTTLANNDLVTVVLTSNATPCLTSSPATSNTVTMTVNPNLPASVSIGASATTICLGTSVTFTATPTNGGSTPSYQWKLNGSNVGTNSSTYTTSALANGNTVSVVMTSNANPCLTGSPATSNIITMTVNPNLPASVSIGASATTICSGTSVTFTATPTNGGTTPSYQWKVNGSNVGTNSATYTSSSLLNSDVVSVVMTSNATPCLTGSPATSNTITMAVNPNLPASVSVSASATTICLGTSVTFIATPTNGGSTPSYQWKVNGTNVGTNSATYTTSTLANGNTVSVVMTSNATPCLIGSPTTSNTVAMTVNALPSAVIASNNGPSMCPGSNVVFTVTGTSAATITYNLNGGNNTTATLTAGLATITVNGATSTQMLNLVSVSNGCTTLIGSSSTVSIETTIWNGSIWDNGLPNSSKAVVFTGDYTMTSDFSACSISVSGGAVVSVDSGKNVSLNGAITVASGSSFILNTNANLYQSDASAVNTGNVIVKRDSNPLIRLDYTMWSSPVEGQKLFAFSPLTSISPTVRFYTYNSTTNSYNSVATPSTTDFATGKGYLIRLPYNHPTAPAVWNGAFTGVPNNGTKTVTLTNIDETHQYNAVGNPYPSPISISQFASDNASNIEPTIYFWRKTNNASKPSYCTWNCASQTFISNGEAFSANPNGVIQTGQGFIVEAKGSATSLVFNNGQRVVNNTNHFFKTTSSSATTSTQAHRIWLNLTGAATEYSQAVVGYFTNATQGADDYDSKLFNDGSITLSTKIDADDYVIQSRPAPFDASDVVPLNFKVTTAGTYTFAIDHVDGLFTAGAQEVYLKDNLDGSYHNITTTPYSFATTAGTFSNRFELVYQNLLSSNETSFTANSIVVYHQQNDVVINTGSATMSSVKVYDIRGRLLVEKKDVNASETKINVGTTNQVILVQVTTNEGLKATKKVVN